MGDFTETRSFLAANVDTVLENIQARRQRNKISADDLFSDVNEVSHTIRWKTDFEKIPPLTVLLQEKYSLGLYVSGNPLQDFARVQEWCRNNAYEDNIYLILTNKVKKIFTKSNKMMFALQISTIDEEIEAIIFPKIAPEYSPILEEKQLYWVRGKINRKKKKQSEPSPTIDTTEEGITEEEGQQPTVSEEVKEYDELPKLLVEKLCKFTDGILPLYAGDSTFSVSRRRVFEHVQWPNIYTNPTQFESFLSPQSHNQPRLTNQDNSNVHLKTPSVQSHPAPPATGVKVIKISKNVGVEKIKALKSAMRQEPGPGLELAEIWIEQSDGFKKVKGTWFIPSSMMY